MKIAQNIVIAFLFIQSGIVQGQVDHLVTLRGDTLLGQVTFPNAEGKVERLWFQSGTQGKRLFVATQLRSVRHASEDYKVINYNGYRFMLVVREGYLNVLKFRSPGSFEFSETLLYKKDGTMTEIPLMGFRKPIGSFLSDCKKVSMRVRTKELGPKDLYQIVDEYNLCISNESVASSAQPNSDKTESFNESQDLAGGEELEMAQLIKQLKTRYKYSNINSKDFNAILKDIERKIDEDEEVPAYLINALKSSSGGNSGLLETIDKIERSLN